MSFEISNNNLPSRAPAARCRKRMAKRRFAGDSDFNSHNLRKSSRVRVADNDKSRPGIFHICLLLRAAEAKRCVFENAREFYSLNDPPANCIFFAGGNAGASDLTPSAY